MSAEHFCRTFQIPNLLRLAPALKKKSTPGIFEDLLEFGAPPDSSAICWILALTTLMIVESIFRFPSISKSISASVICVFRISRIPFALTVNSASVFIPVGSILLNTNAEVCMCHIYQQSFAVPSLLYFKLCDTNGGIKLYWRSQICPLTNVAALGSNCLTSAILGQSSAKFYTLKSAIFGQEMA